MKIQTQLKTNELRAVAKFLGTDDTRYALNGVRFDFSEQGLCYVATDGRKMACLMADPDPFPAIAFTVPHPVVGMVAAGDRRTVPVEISDEDGELVVKLFLEHGVLELTSNNDGLIDEKYPNWREVVPTAQLYAVPHMTIRLEFLATCQAAADELGALDPVMQFRGTDQVVTVQFNSTPEFFAILMPMRDTAKPEPLPAWLRKAITPAPLPQPQPSDI